MLSCQIISKPKCQINYIGSKYRLLDFIEETIQDAVPNLEEHVFCDLFAGTGIVGRFFKPRVRSVIANDIEYYSYVFCRNYIRNNQQFNHVDRLKYLNELPGVEGFIFNNYCEGGSERMYFSNENGKKIDAIRMEIENWLYAKLVNTDEYYFYLCALLEAADQVANTASVYGAFLKTLKKTASRPLELHAPEFAINRGGNVAYNQDANELIHHIEGGILYLDPPYNQRDYGANYHLLNTIAKYDKFLPRGKTGLRNYTRSTYCSKKTVAESFEEIIKAAKFNYIFLSYNNEGLMSISEIQTIMEKYGKYDMRKKDYSRFKADSKREYKEDSTREYLHILIR